MTMTMGGTLAGERSRKAACLKELKQMSAEFVATKAALRAAEAEVGRLREALRDIERSADASVYITTKAEYRRDMGQIRRRAANALAAPAPGGEGE